MLTVQQENKILCEKLIEESQNNNILNEESINMLIIQSLDNLLTFLNEKVY